MRCPKARCPDCLLDTKYVKKGKWMVCADHEWKPQDWALYEDQERQRRQGGTEKGKRKVRGRWRDQSLGVWRRGGTKSFKPTRCVTLRVAVQAAGSEVVRVSGRGAREGGEFCRGCRDCEGTGLTALFHSLKILAPLRRHVLIYLVAVNAHPQHGQWIEYYVQLCIPWLHPMF